jgi:maltose alpha-D-glucosyltransferase/alpha-amylase
MAAYSEALAEKRLWPTDPQASECLLQFFQLERAVYEVDHELSNRPDWIRLPAMAVLNLIKD